MIIVDDFCAETQYKEFGLILNLHFRHFWLLSEIRAQCLFHPKISKIAQPRDQGEG